MFDDLKLLTMADLNILLSLVRDRSDFVFRRTGFVIEYDWAFVFVRIAGSNAVVSLNELDTAISSEKKKRA